MAAGQKPAPDTTMTHSPLPYTANGESLLDARGNVVATFVDYRDAIACAACCEETPDLRKEIERLEDKVAQLEDDARDIKLQVEQAHDVVDDTLRFVRSMREAMTDDFATLDATIGELTELKEKLGA